MAHSAASGFSEKVLQRWKETDEDAGFSDQSLQRSEETDEDAGFSEKVLQRWKETSSDSFSTWVDTVWGPSVAPWLERGRREGDEAGRTARAMVADAAAGAMNDMNGEGGWQRSSFFEDSLRAGGWGADCQQHVAGWFTEARCGAGQGRVSRGIIIDSATGIFR